VKEPLIPVTKGLTILLDCRRRHRRIAKARMTIKNGWTSRGHVAPGRFESIVKTPSGKLTGGRWRRIVGDRSGMGTTGDQERR
jgi:hypothetical protein